MIYRNNTNGNRRRSFGSVTSSVGQSFIERKSGVVDAVKQSRLMNSPFVEQTQIGGHQNASVALIRLRMSGESKIQKGLGRHLMNNFYVVETSLTNNVSSTVEVITEKTQLKHWLRLRLGKINIGRGLTLTCSAITKPSTSATQTTGLVLKSEARLGYSCAGIASPPKPNSYSAVPLSISNAISNSNGNLGCHGTTTATKLAVGLSTTLFQFMRSIFPIQKISDAVFTSLIFVRSASKRTETNGTSSILPTLMLSGERCYA